MPKRGLKNLVREDDVQNGVRTWRLVTLDGTRVDAFDVFCARNAEYAPTTRKRYAEAVARFLDYLFEAGVMAGPVAASHLNRVVDAFPLLLQDGSSKTAARIEAHRPEVPEEQWLARVARALDWDPLLPNSLANALAAVNRFLKLSESLAREARERAQLYGIQVRGDRVDALIQALDGHETLSRHEVARIKQNSLLGSVAKFVPTGIRRARRLRSATVRTTTDRRHLDFPLDALPRLIECATSWRDRALWLLLAASGIRLSEARNLLLDDIDLVEQQVYVFDPSGRRFALDDSDPASHRYKGRSMSLTYLFSPLREQFFDALVQYLAHEYVPSVASGKPRYLFQYVEATKRGLPLVNASDSTLAKSFKRAQRAADVPCPVGAREWTVHSLRHLYGVYMLNDFPLNPAEGEFGLKLVEVQMLMGHQSIRSTQHYARSKHRRLAAKLQAADEAILALSEGEARRLPNAVLNRLEARG